MCRLFGSMSVEPAPVSRWLVESERSLLAQSNVTPEYAQKDGWGIAWYDAGNRPTVVKGTGGAFQMGEKERFLEAAQGARGPTVIGHLRHASNPLDLPRERLIGLSNSQPFTFGDLLFAHNGAIPFPTETRPLLGPFDAKVSGVNDSEVLFWLLVRHTQSCGDPLEAYARTVADLWEVWLKKGAPASGPYSGVNVLFSRGPDELWAFCNWHGEWGSGFLDDRPYYQMAYRADAFEVVFGSEPFDGTADDWKPIPNAGYVHALRSGSRIELRSGWVPIRKPMTAAPTSE